MLYLSFPSPQFPTQLPDSVQSLEEADTETPQRRAYFTNLSREEIFAHYKSQLQSLVFFGQLIPALRLNYPPEDAYSIIRDQTRSVYLEEVLYPIRESIFINGFVPKQAKDEIWYKGSRYEQKITVKYSSSNSVLRLLITGIGVLVFFIIIQQYSDFFKKMPLRIWQ